MVSTRFSQCQTVIGNNLWQSSNNDVVRIYYDTNCNTNLQYDQFKSAKDVLTQLYLKNKEDRITSVLTTLSLVINQYGSMRYNRLLKVGPDQFQSCRRIFTTFLFATSITNCQMQPACIYGANQHHLYVYIVIKI